MWKYFWKNYFSRAVNNWCRYGVRSCAERVKCSRHRSHRQRQQREIQIRPPPTCRCWQPVTASIPISTPSASIRPRRRRRRQLHTTTTTTPAAKTARPINTTTTTKSRSTLTPISPHLRLRVSFLPFYSTFYRHFYIGNFGCSVFRLNYKMWWVDQFSSD
jgi:hypothetical protein